MDFFKFRGLNEEHGAGDTGTSSLVAKYKTGTPGQTSPAPSRQPARKGDKLNAKMDYSSKIKQDDITVKNSMSEAFDDPEAEKSEMALTKLHFIEYATEEIMEYVEMGGYIEEWYQIKLAKVHADMEGLHSYMEGEKRRTGMAMGEAVQEGKNKQMKGKDPCWKGYQMVGTKKKNGKEVPNCVPANEEKTHTSPSGVKTNMDPSDDDYDINYGKNGLAAKFRKSQGLDVKTGKKKTNEAAEIQEAKMKDSEVLSAAKSLAANGKDEKTKSFGKGLVDFYNKNNGFTPDQVAGLQNIMKNASFQMAKEGVMKNMKRSIKGTDAESRAGDEATKMMKAQQSGDSAAASKYNNRYKKLAALTKKESYASAAQRKAVWASKNEKGIKEKLDPSQGAGEYVKDFQKSDAPQFKGKTKKERQKMAVAAYLGAKEDK